MLSSLLVIWQDALVLLIHKFLLKAKKVSLSISLLSTTALVFSSSASCFDILEFCDHILWWICVKFYLCCFCCFLLYCFSLQNSSCQDLIALCQYFLHNLHFHAVIASSLPSSASQIIHFSFTFFSFCIEVSCIISIAYFSCLLRASVCWRLITLWSRYRRKWCVHNVKTIHGLLKWSKA